MNNFWKDKKIFITGHSGFKGSWLVSRLMNLGANVAGYSLKETDNRLFSLLKLQNHIQNTWGDIRDESLLSKTIYDFKPDIIIHLAAQALVKTSYLNPIDTFSTNILGTLCLLESCRNVDSIRVILNVTSDKVYVPNLIGESFPESSPLGGIDPYSASKSCSEIVTKSYYESFLKQKEIRVGSARSGNVVGGGDWSKDRLVPDLIRSITNNKKLKIRYPNSIRPWQHVLDTIEGYLKFANFLYNSETTFTALNFGPPKDEGFTVYQFLSTVQKIYPNLNIDFQLDSPTAHEEGLIRLDSTLAIQKLGWKNKFSFEQTVSKTIEWYLRYRNGEDAWDLTKSQILDYQKV